jgi:hypothetical protein
MLDESECDVDSWMKLGGRKGDETEGNGGRWLNVCTSCPVVFLLRYWQSSVFDLLDPRDGYLQKCNTSTVSKGGSCKRLTDAPINRPVFIDSSTKR